MIDSGPLAPQLTREQQRRDVSVTATLDGYALGDAHKVLQLAVPSCLRAIVILLIAEAKTIGDSNWRYSAITSGFALVILLVLSACPRASIPPRGRWSRCCSASPARVYAVLFTGAGLDTIRKIGFDWRAVGIMAKNSILIVEFANQLRDQGYNVREAIEQSANIRLRPAGDDDRDRARRRAAACHFVPAPKPARPSAGSSSAALACGDLDAKLLTPWSPTCALALLLEAAPVHESERLRPQRWSSATTEMVALARRIGFAGRCGV